jgi:tetratricopeptide (TPR) repeat protein
MIPTRDVPLGLSADEYFRLSIQYLLLGWKQQMVIAAKKAIDLRADLHGKLPYDLKTEDYEKIGIALGVVEGAMDIAVGLSDVFRDTWKVLTDAITAADQALDEVEPLTEIKKEVQSVFNSFAKEAGDLFNKAVEGFVLPALGMPGRDLPVYETAPEYIEAAKQYRTLGWCEQARDSLEKAIEIAREPATARMARQYLATRIPRQPVPHMAVQRNIQGHHQMVRGDLEAARKTFEALVVDYPDFEWPRGNLGLVYAQLGLIDKAEQVLSDVLDYNPDYLNAWLHLARLKAAKLEVREAQRYLDKALRLDPDDQPAQALRQLVDFLSL